MAHLCRENTHYKALLKYYPFLRVLVVLRKLLVVGRKEKQHFRLILS